MRLEKLCVAMFRFRRRSGLSELVWANHTRRKGMGSVSSCFLHNIIIRDSKANGTNVSFSVLDHDHLT